MKKCIYLILPLCLFACATTSVAPSPDLPWSSRQVALTALTDWSISGKIGIRTATEAQTVHFSWKQRQQSYHISLFGPAGVGAITIDGQPGLITLRNVQGEQQTDTSPEALLEDTLGWSLPLSDLIFWIRGLPNPNQPAITEFDEHHRLSQLEQNGFTVRYLSYQYANALELPKKLIIENNLLKTTIIIDRTH